MLMKKDEEKQKEQKPAEWREKMKQTTKNTHPEEYPSSLAECISPREYGLFKQLQQDCIETIEQELYSLGKEHEKDYDPRIKFLKSLRLQPKEEWSKEDEEIFNNIIEKAKGGHWIQMDEIAWLIARFKSLRPQPKQEWSEEDEILRVRTINRLETLNFHGISSKEIHESIDWLKSLPLNLKKKNEDVAKLCSNEWSKEDEKIYQTVFKHFNSYKKYSCSTGVKKEHVLSWLKSLKPSWKPSDEQLRPLEYAIDYFKKKQNDTTYLESLYNDLKKL